MHTYTSSKSIIGKMDMDRETGKVSVSAVFSKFHGKPEEQGVTLLRFYMDAEKVDALMDGGDICVLASCAETSIFYHRDFGQERKWCFFERDKLAGINCMEDFFRFDWEGLAPDTREGSPVYLYTDDGWFIAPLGSDRPPEALHEEVMAHGRASGQFEKLEDAPYFHGTDPNYPDSASPSYVEERASLLSFV